MKRNNNLAFALLTFAALAFTSGAALAGPHHWGNNSGNVGGYSQLTDAQQATAQKLHNDFYNQTSALRQQIASKRYEYNALLTADKPDSAKIEGVAQEIETLQQKLDRSFSARSISLSCFDSGHCSGNAAIRGSCRLRGIKFNPEVSSGSATSAASSFPRRT